MRNNLKDIDGTLSSDEKHISLILQTLVKNTLNKYLEESYYEKDNYDSCTINDIRKAVPFPFSRFYPFYLKFLADIRNYVNNYNKNSIEFAVEEGYKILSETLEKLSGEYFFGSKPTSLDALVFGHISSAINQPIISLLLKNSKRDCSNLISFWQMFREKHFLSSKQKILCDKSNVFDNACSLAYQQMTVNRALWETIQLNYANNGKSSSASDNVESKAPAESDIAEVIALYPGSRRYMFCSVFLFLGYLFSSVEIVIE